MGHAPSSSARVDAQLPDGVVAPDGLVEAFWAYETALMADDLGELDRLFADGADTIRGDAQGLLVGHDAISAFRRGRGGAPKRVITAVHVRPIGDDDAVVVALTRTPAGGRGQQTQLWSRQGPGSPWAVRVAHVAGPSPAIVPSVWRVTGSPLVPASGSGELDGLTVAVKDLFAIEGQRIGGGVPAFLAQASVQPETASAVQRLLDAGASVAGIAQTDQFAYSIAGTNPAYGTPPNPAVVGGISGGSSSGPASAVALGQVHVGLGTDTGGSVRVPASYQGLWGLRTTHGAVAADRMLPLAPSFDTIGWLTRDAPTLAAAARVGLDDPAAQVVAPVRYAVVPAVLDVLEPDVRAAFVATVDALGLEPEPVDVGDLAALLDTYRTVQAAEAWQVHGAWIDAHPDALAPEVAARFAAAAALDEAAVARAREAHAAAAERIRAVLADRVLLVPSASSVAPQTTADPAEIDRVRTATMRITCISGLAGLPAVSVPAMTVDGGPVGLCLVGPTHTDLALIDRGVELLGSLS